MKTAAFYSFKGGVGRSLAAYHVARECTAHGLRVLLWDLDLEAPGLTMLPALTHGHEIREGTVELLLEMRSTAPEPKVVQSAVIKYKPIDEKWVVTESVEECVLMFLPAGAVDAENYGDRLGQLDLSGKLDLAARDLEKIRQFIEMELHPDIILIDSRTGISSEAILSTTQLSDLVVALTALNEQSLRGTLPLLGSLTSGRGQDAIILVASPIPVGEGELVAERLRHVRETCGRNVDVFLPYLPRLSLSDDPVQRNEAPFLFEAYKELASLLLERIGASPVYSKNSIREAITNGRFTEALEAAERAARQWPRDPDVQLLLAVAARGLGLFERARDYLLHGSTLASASGLSDAPFTTALSDLASVLRKPTE